MGLLDEKDHEAFPKDKHLEILDNDLDLDSESEGSFIIQPVPSC